MSRNRLEAGGPVSGVDLSDEGRHQAQRLSERLADDSIRAIYASPLSRTLETAVIAPLRITTKSASAAYQDDEP